MATRPNVLVICTDQHRFDAISTHPGSAAITPHLEALAAEGTVFDRCYTTSPVCSPARASMLTGRYPSSHGLWGNGVTLPDDSDLVSAELRTAGYRCGLVGKLHLSAAFQGRTEHRLDDGFEHLRWAHDPFHGSPENAYHAWLKQRFPELWERASASAFTEDVEEFNHDDTPFDAMPVEAHYSTWVTEEVCDFIEDAGDRPFFLVANFYDPHHPFVAPQEYVDRYPPGSVPPSVGGPDELAGKPDVQSDASRRSYVGHGPSYPDFGAEELDELRRTYFAMVSLVDDCVGRILDTLRQKGLEQDTLVVFTSDHGEMLGDHALLLKGPMMYDVAVRVPMIVRWPGRVPAGHRVGDGFVGLHDVASTVRDATGLPPSDRDQGASLVAVAAGDAPPRRYALCEYRDSGYPYDPPVHTTMYRTDRHKLVVWHGEPATSAARSGELYDLAEDPDELHNLWDREEHLRTQSDLYAQLADVVVSLEDRRAPRVAPW